MSQRKLQVVEKDLIISRDPEVVSGAPVFAGTRTPVQALFDYLEADSTISEFREGFPRVEHEQAKELLKRIAKLIQNGEISV